MFTEREGMCREREGMFNEREEMFSEWLIIKMCISTIL